MKTKNGFLCFPRSRIVLVIGFLCLAVSLTGCDVIRQFFSFEKKDEPIAVPMQATGEFESMAVFNPNCIYLENTITLRWEEFPDTGDRRFVGGDGKRYSQCGDTVEYQDLKFEGSMSEDNFEGIVHVTGKDIMSDEEFVLDYPAAWKATRPHDGGDYIEGTVDGMGGFILKVQPAPEGWEEDF